MIRYGVGEIRRVGRRCKGRDIPGVALENTSADVEPGIAITIACTVERYQKTANGPCYRPVSAVNTFRIGDEAICDSWNLAYIGRITAIGAKTVTIVEDDGKTHRLGLYEFCLRNRALDLEAVRARNADTMMTI